MAIEAPSDPAGVVVAGRDPHGTLAALAFAQSLPPDASRGTLFVIPIRRTRWRWLFPFANWRALRLARRLRRRGAVATVPS